MALEYLAKEILSLLVPEAVLALHSFDEFLRECVPTTLSTTKSRLILEETDQSGPVASSWGRISERARVKLITALRLIGRG
jgi:hypothetical protein